MYYFYPENKPTYLPIYYAELNEIFCVSFFHENVHMIKFWCRYNLNWQKICIKFVGPNSIFFL